MTLSEAVEAVGKLLTAWPNGGAQAGKSYIGVLASILCEYPRAIASRCADPIRGVARGTEYLPTVATLVRWCEEQSGPVYHTTDFERRSEIQLAQRDEYERLPPPNPDVIARVRSAMKAAGMPILGDKFTENEFTPTKTKAKLGLSDEQWNAIPNAPPDSTWAKLRGTGS